MPAFPRAAYASSPTKRPGAAQPIRSAWQRTLEEGKSVRFQPAPPSLHRRRESAADCGHRTTSESRCQKNRLISGICPQTSMMAIPKAGGYCYRCQPVRATGWILSPRKSSFNQSFLANRPAPQKQNLRHLDWPPHPVDDPLQPSPKKVTCPPVAQTLVSELSLSVFLGELGSRQPRIDFLHGWSHTEHESETRW